MIAVLIAGAVLAVVIAVIPVDFWIANSVDEALRGVGQWSDEDAADLGAGGERRVDQRHSEHNIRT